MYDDLNPFEVLPARIRICFTKGSKLRFFLFRRALLIFSCVVFFRLPIENVNRELRSTRQWTTINVQRP